MFFFYRHDLDTMKIVWHTPCGYQTEAVTDKGKPFERMGHKAIGPSAGRHRAASCQTADRWLSAQTYSLCQGTENRFFVCR